MLDKKFIQKALTDFGDNVVKESRNRLASSSPSSNDTNKLSKSIGYDLEVSNKGTSFAFSFEMEEYGAYQDQGVRGVGGPRKTTSKFKTSSGKTNNRGKLWRQKGPKGTPFSFKEGKRPPVKAFEGWSKRKGLSPFAVAESVYRQGLEAKKFFTIPFNEQFAKLPDELLKAFGDDLDNFLKA